MIHRSRAALSAAVLCSAAGLARAQALGEAFDDVENLFQTGGWVQQNNSAMPGLGTWFQGDLTEFEPQATSGYIAVNFESTTGNNTISNWLLTPPLSLHNGDVFSFWTRTVTDPVFADRLQVRLSTSGTSTNVGADPLDVGDFGSLLLDIDPTYDPSTYPDVWTRYTVTLSDLPAGGAQGRIAFRYFVENGGPSGDNSDYIGIDSVAFDSAANPPGACCMDTGCQVLGGGECVARGGVYRGDGVTCALSNCPPPTVWAEQGDAGELPATAQVVSGPGATELQSIRGSIDSESDTDMYRIQVCTPAEFGASTVGATLVDTKLALFDDTGHGVTQNDDDPSGSGFQSVLSSQFISHPGMYYLAITTFGNGAHGVDTDELIWFDLPSNTERQPDGPAMNEAIGRWDGEGTDSGAYVINLMGSCFTGAMPPAPCYANCDGGTATPFLNVNDFICFQGKFAAGDTYANCDNSTQAPVLNVNDFICFQGKFAAGCSAP